MNDFFLVKAFALSDKLDGANLRLDPGMAHQTLNFFEAGKKVLTKSRLSKV